MFFRSEMLFSVQDYKFNAFIILILLIVDYFVIHIRILFLLIYVTECVFRNNVTSILAKTVNIYNCELKS